MYKFIGQMARDNRLDTYHLSLFCAIAYLGKDTLPGGYFNISRKEVLSHSGIRSQVTYHNRLKDLVDYGYLRYQPSYDPGRHSRAALLI